MCLDSKYVNYSGDGRLSSLGKVKGMTVELRRVENLSRENKVAFFKIYNVLVENRSPRGELVSYFTYDWGQGTILV